MTAMRKGLVFLADEISLADDSVIERLNSVLEPERQVLLAEKIDSNETEVVTATDKFRYKILYILGNLFYLNCGFRCIGSSLF